MDFLTHL